MIRLSISLAALALLLFAQPSPAPLIYVPGEGWRYESVGADKDWQKTRAKDQLEVAKQAFEAKEFRTALRAAKRVVRRWPFSDFTPEAQYLAARCYEERGKSHKAFKEYQKLLTLHPQTDNYEEILNRQYIIATRFFEGEWFKLWGYIPTPPSMTKTIALYEQLIKNGPYSPVAPEAQMKIGEAYEKKILTDYPQAAKAYERAADRYHETPIGIDALFKVGETYNKQAKTSEYDQSIASQAISTFTDFITLHPTDERVPSAHKYIGELRTEQARGSFEIARYYEKKHRWKAAEIYYNEVLTKDPESKYGDEARYRIDAIRNRQTIQ